MTPDPIHTETAEPGGPPADPAMYELAYEEAKRTLEDQQNTVTEVRARAGQLSAAAAITTSLFGAQATPAITRPGAPRRRREPCTGGARRATRNGQ